MRANNCRELRKLYDVCKQYIKSIKVHVSDHYDLDTFLTIVMELKFDEVKKLKWMEFSNDYQMTAPYKELLKFLDLQAQHYKLMSFKQKMQLTAHKSYMAVFEQACVACS